ncbi:nicotinate phosphoribosyltransferase [Halosegnis marinus]|uniref:nicotinate phosphoribosyltransferase n=1 Tax=Halosegnis marinus TaxID=3034023 RepID=A0ABD5ZND5_9EURY|nr:nicotinate phosphoribosyltransferase [Halosegnis sp. DT85]
MFDIVSPEAIRDGRATDAYFERTRDALEGAGRDPHVVCEVTADQFPDGSFETFAGVKDAAHLFEGRDVTVHALGAGQLFDGGPVMRIEGSYLAFAELETSLLGFLSSASGWATGARRVVSAAGDDVSVLSFGARHVHPSTAAALERAALVGGVDGFSHVAAGEVLGREPSGTMPHALVICFGRGEQEAAWRAFDDHSPEDVPRIALTDTYSDEVDEALRAAAAVEDLHSVRLDTTGSRRGDFRHIVREVRWALDDAGHEDVGVFVSGGIGADDVRELRDDVEGFGVGSAISNAEPVDFALDIVERDGESAAKRGKLSGAKQVYRSGEDHVVRPADEPGPTDGRPLLRPLVEDGEIVRDFSVDEAAKRCASDAERVGFGDEE